VNENQILKEFIHPGKAYFNLVGRLEEIFVKINLSEDLTVLIKLCKENEMGIDKEYMIAYLFD
jgi:hypothetical protein